VARVGRTPSLLAHLRELLLGVRRSHGVGLGVVLGAITQTPLYYCQQHSTPFIGRDGLTAWPNEMIISASGFESGGHHLRMT
jgi:hypothetical protein